MRELFQVVYELKKKDVDKTKQYSFDAGQKTVETHSIQLSSIEEFVNNKEIIEIIMNNKS